MTYAPRPGPQQQPQNAQYGQHYGQPAQPQTFGGYPTGGYSGVPYYNAYSPYGGAPVLRPSPVGIISFILGLLSGAGLLALLAVATVMAGKSGGKVDEQSPEVIMLGLMVIAGLFFALVGAILGLVAVMQRDRKKLFGILGLVINGGVLLVVLALFVIGLAVK